MQANRRRFLKLLGVGTASAPLAAKAVAEQQALGLVKFGDPLNKGIDAGSAYGGAPASIGQQVKGVWESPYMLAHKYIQTFGKVPEFIEEDIKQRAKHITHLDPDIACKKSWSLNVKIAEQRQRNYNYLIKRYEMQGGYELKQNAFQKLTGFQWPW